MALNFQDVIRDVHNLGNHAFQVTLIDPPASTVSIVDTGGYYTGTEVETALAEIGAGTTLDARYVKITGSTMTGQLNFSGTTHAGVKLLSLTTVQRDALTASAGMVIYNTTDAQFQGYAAAWAQLGGGAQTPWTSDVNAAGYKLIGNTTTTGDLTLQTTSGVGATGADMHFLVGNNGATEAMTILNSGNVGIGTTGPGAILHVEKSGTTSSDGTFRLLQSGLASGNYNSLLLGKAATNNQGVLLGYTYSGNGIFSINHWGDTNTFNITSGGGTGTTSGNVGIGTTSPTNLLSLGGDSARIFWMERHTTANTAGNTLTVQAGGATSGATDKAGGDLIIQPGVSTGSAESGVQIKGCVAGASGTADRTQTTAIQVLGNKIGFYAVTPVVRPTALTTQLTTITATAPGTPDYLIQDLVQNTGFGFVTADEGQSVLKVILNLQTRVAELETKLQGLGLLT